MILILAALLLVALPVWAINQSGLVKLIGQIVLTIVLLVVIGATGLFGYICIKAQAKKWGGGLLIIAILAVLAVYWVWTGRLPLL